MLPSETATSLLRFRVSWRTRMNVLWRLDGLVPWLCEGFEHWRIRNRGAYELCSSKGNVAHALRSIFDTTCTMQCYLRFQKKFLINSTQELRNISYKCEDRHQIADGLQSISVLCNQVHKYFICIFCLIFKFCFHVLPVLNFSLSLMMSWVGDTFLLRFS